MNTEDGMPAIERCGVGHDAPMAGCTFCKALNADRLRRENGTLRAMLDEMGVTPGYIDERIDREWGPLNAR